MNQVVRTWVNAMAEATAPDRVVWFGGSDEEARAIEARWSRTARSSRSIRRATRAATCTARIPATSRAPSTSPSSARRDKDDAGPTNNWMSPDEAQAQVWPLFEGAMRGRTMYVVPYLMGPPGSPYSRVGVELTDSPYVVANLRIMTRMGHVALDELGELERLRARAPLPRRSLPRAALHRAISPRRERSGASAPATAATRCSARNATRCASRASRRATRAGSPSTC